MRFSARTWSLLSLLLFVAAAFFWLKGNEYEERRRNALPAAAPSTPPGASIELFSTKNPPAQLTSLASSGLVTAQDLQNGQLTEEQIDQRFPHRLRNTRRPLDELARDDGAILLANALIDTATELPVIPEHLRAAGDPGSFIIQWDKPVDEQFRSLIREVGAEIISYVPNNAFYVKVDQAGADRLAITPGVQSVLRFEPYYKLDQALLAMAVGREQLPPAAVLRLTLLPGTRDAAVNDLAALGAMILAEEPSPFGPQVLISPLPDSLADLARLSSVQGIERSGARIPASDLSRITLGIAIDGGTNQNSNYFGLSGSNVVVNINDTGIQTNHPALRDTVIYLPEPPLARLMTTNGDPEGHGTFVASLIAGSGEETPSAYQTNVIPGTGTNAATTNVVVAIPGSSTNANFKGLAPGASLLALPLDPTAPGFPDLTEKALDSFLISRVAASNYVALGRTNAIISNNSWTYGIATYDSSAARFDAAVRDAMPGTPYEQPLLFVFAAGNNGNGDEEGAGGVFDSIESPGTAKNVITVGALETARLLTNAFFTLTNYFYSTNSDGTIVTNEETENIYPFTGITDTSNQVASFSGRGNVGIGIEGAAGRFKPDVVAPGTMLIAARSENWNLDGIDTNDVEFGKLLTDLNTNLVPYRFGSGSTFAAANVSGFLALVQEYFERRSPAEMRGPLSPAGMKAVLINGSRSLSALYDMAVKSPANFQGWGLPNLPNSLTSYNTNDHSNLDPIKWRMRLVDQSASNAVATGQSRTWNVTLSSNAAVFPLRATLVWTDPPGNPNVAVKLVNDLDLVITNLDSGAVFYGNNIPVNADFTEPVLPEEIVSEPVDVVNNVEQVLIRNPALFGREFSITVRGRRVNVNSVYGHFAETGSRNDVVQDYALVVSSDMGEDDAMTDPLDPDSDLRVKDVFEVFDRVAAVNIEPRAPITVVTNGVPLLEERVGANPTLVGTNGVAGQWNFYVFTNLTTSNELVSITAGSNVAFVTFNPPNLSVQRASEADIDLYVSTDPNLTNLNPIAIRDAWTSTEPGGTEMVAFTNAALGTVYYIGVKAEDQQAAEFSFIGVSSDQPFERDQDGRSILIGVPFEAAVLDGTARRPTAGTMLAIGLSTRRVANVEVTNVVTHENFPDLVGVFSHDKTRVILNNHTFVGVTNYGTNLLTYVDNPMFARTGTRPTDGPGSLNMFAGHKIVGPWFLEMIDNSPSHTGRVQLLTVVVDPLREEIEIGRIFTDTVEPGRMAFYPLESPPGATNLIFEFTSMDGPLEFYIRQGELPTTNVYDFRTNLVAPGGRFSFPTPTNAPLSPGTYFVGLRNVTASPVTFTLLVTAQFADPGLNRLNRSGSIEELLDAASTNEVIDVPQDRLVADVAVGVRMKHPRASDVVLTLISPQGTRVMLAENRGHTNNAGFGASMIMTNDTLAGPVISTQATYTVFTDSTNLARLPVKFANPGSGVTLGAVGVPFANGFEGSLAGNYRVGTTLAARWIVTGSPADTNTPEQISIISAPRFAHTGTNLMSLGTAGVRRSFPISRGAPYTLRFAARAGQLMDFYSTGIDDDGFRLQPGEVDPHYQILMGNNTVFYGTEAFVVHTNTAPFTSRRWQTNSAFSQWIAPYAVPPEPNMGVGQYIFRTYVNLYEQNPRLVLPRFRWAGDDYGMFVRVNGVALPNTFGGNPAAFSTSPIQFLSGLSAGLNVIDFFIDEYDFEEGLRVEVLSGIDRALKNPLPAMSVAIGGTTRVIEVEQDWKEFEIDFTPATTNETLTILTTSGEVWIDSVSVETSGDIYVRPEESLEVLDGERAMGEWRLEVRDSRTGAILPTDEVVDWKVEIVFANTANPAVILQPGDLVSGTLRSNQVQYIVLDPCPGATFARMILTGIDNREALMVLASHSGFPTGDPNTDDFLPMTNDENEGQPDGQLTFELSSLLPAPSNLRGKPIYLALFNRFLDATNLYEIDFISDGICVISGPPPVLAPGTPTPGTLDPVGGGGGGTNVLSDAIYQVTVSPSIVSMTITVESDGDVSLMALNGNPPSIDNFSHFRNALTGAGTEELVIATTSDIPLTPGNWFIRVANNTDREVSYTITVTLRTSGGSGTPPILDVLPMANGQMQLRWNSEAGVEYEVQTSADLVNWTTLARVTASSAITTYLHTNPAGTVRFYRVRGP